jgi:hypothetical protein
MLGARLPPNLLVALGAWAAAHAKGMLRAESIRRLVAVDLQKWRAKP